MDLQAVEQHAFKAEEVTKLVTTAIENRLKNQQYDEDQVEQWVNDICEDSLAKLYALKKPFKYVVTCVVSQRTGVGIHSANACYWDTVSDGEVSVSWPKRNSRDPNQSLFVVVTVFAANFSPS